LDVRLLDAVVFDTDGVITDRARDPSRGLVTRTALDRSRLPVLLVATD
jgi:hypothetical protein